jgi:predicted ester cyclase
MITEQQFRENLQRILDAVNARDWNALGKLVDESFTIDYVCYLPGMGEPARGPEGFKRGIRGMAESNPGYRATVEDALVMGDKAAARLMIHRTDPATGKAQRCSSIMLNHLRGRQFAEDWQLVSPWEDEG